MTGLSILQSVYTLLKKNEELVKRVNNRIYPLIAKENTLSPFIVFQRDSLQVNYCKDGVAEDLVTVSVTIVSSNYTDSVDIAELVRDSLELKRLDKIKSIRIVSTSEDFVDDGYLQQLQFEFNVLSD